MKWIVKLAGIIALIIVAMIYGYSVGKYEVFPYSVMYDLKKKINFSDVKIKRSPVYENKSSLYETFTSKSDIVMFGDSYIEYGNWSDIFPIKISNRGIAGDDSVGMIARIDQAWKARPKKVFIMVGINDIDKNIPSNVTVKNINYMVSILNRRGIEVYVNSVVYSGESKKKRNKYITDINTQLEKLSKHSKFTFINLNDALAPNGVLLKSNSSDDTHLNSDGYKIWRDKLKQYMQ
ncbi:GDSL-type esterase/lipase family protein [Escherichia albertii]|uniref:GDSL-type esterase/lipase family protein n=1 Tax=Escherichia albertii TaxID=208962 RepID=UPI0010F52DD1|nr:GDSL-type esterase/lipase family protein [Escherichia albertii]MCZ9080309.1 GDSL-type esterase/lipase family protein [Escherichia albertii]